MRHVLAAMILHEANSFAAPAPLAHFERQGVVRGAEIGPRFGPTRTEMGGFLAYAAEAGWRLTTPIAVPCSPAGPMDAGAFAAIRDALVAGARAAGKVDGVLLGLHGACVAVGEDDADGALAQAVREIVGPDVPIVVTLDPHSNVSDRLAAAANAITAYRTHPHVDHFETASRAAGILQRAMDGEIKPRVHLARSWQMRGFDSTRTTPPDGPARRGQALARAMEAADPGVIEVSLQSGFVLADVWHVGPSVAVTGNGADPRFADLAARLVRFCWDERNNDTVKMHTVAEALAAARAVPPGPGPVVVSDFGDAPGGGGYGDATAVLRALLENPVAGAVFASIADPVAAEAARVAGVGAEVALSLGGHVAPAHGGGPIEAVFRVLALSDGKFTHEGPYTPGQMGQFGPSALLECHGIQVIVTTWQRNILDLQQLRIFGIDPTAPPLIAIKCMDAFRAAFAPIARAAIACESGGVSSRVHTSLTWTKVRRPVWPLDPDAAVEAAAGWV
jgi:microcystin degradation protein MlrC